MEFSDSIVDETPTLLVMAFDRVIFRTTQPNWWYRSCVVARTVRSQGIKPVTS